MRRLFRSALARTVAVILLAPHIAGCYVNQHVALEPQVNQARIVGLVMHNGERIMFTHDGASIVHDTIYAVSAQGQVIEATANVDSVLVKTFSTEKTVITGVTLAVVLVIFYTLFTHSASTKFN